MVYASLSTSLHSFSLHRKKLSVPLSLRSSPLQAKLSSFNPAVNRSSISYNPLRFSVGNERIAMERINMKRSCGLSTVCFASPVTARNLQWISTISSVVLMLARGTAIQKSFIVPLFALQAPATVISWIKGEYGIWTAFLALLVRLFFFIPGELEIPFISILLVIVAPYQVLNLRGTQGGSIISLLIAAYLAFQHFSRVGSFRRAFDQNSIIATVAIVFVIVASFLLVI